MLVIWSGCLVMAAKAMDKRKIVPLPLFWLPSISIMQVLHCLAVCKQLISVWGYLGV
jgi:hypothetical protein